MNIKKSCLMVALGLGAASAHAGWNIVGNEPVYTSAGTSGSEVFTVEGSSDLMAGTYNIGAVVTTPLSQPSVSDISSIASAGSVELVNVYFPDPPFPANDKIPGTYLSPYTPLTVTVSWFVPLGTQPKSYDLSVALNYSDGPSGSGIDPIGNVIVIVPAPEPVQTLAGAMLLGCAGLIFAGRRLFKRAPVA